MGCGCFRAPSAGKKQENVIKHNRQEIRGRLDKARKKSVALLAQQAYEKEKKGLAVPKYDWSKSTRDNYQADPASPDYGKYTAPYADIRAMLDEDYHGRYTLERQTIQDELIASVLGQTGPQQERPWVVFTAGAMGAGKSRTMGWLSEHGLFPLSQVVQVDPDLFKPAMPEWDELVKRDALSAGRHTRRESGMLCEILQEAALRMGKHIWVDGSLRDGEWYQKVFRDIQERHSHYQIAIFHVVASREVTYERARLRGEVTGRVVPPEEIEDSIRRVPDAVALLTPLTRFVAVIDNSADDPLLSKWIDPPRGTNGEAKEGQSCQWRQIKARLRFKGYSIRLKNSLSVMGTSHARITLRTLESANWDEKQLPDIGGAGSSTARL